MPTRAHHLVLASLLAGALSGCISSHSTTYTDVDRVKISFSTENAGKLFYEAMNRLPARTPRQQSKTAVHLIVLDLENTTVPGPNRAFNEAVAMCDTNKDGTISEQEAAIFAASAESPKPRT